MKQSQTLSPLARALTGDSDDFAGKALGVKGGGDQEDDQEPLCETHGKHHGTSDRRATGKTLDAGPAGEPGQEGAADDAGARG